jgi:hypothetical protein
MCLLMLVVGLIESEETLFSESVRLQRRDHSAVSRSLDCTPESQNVFPEKENIFRLG